MAEFFIGNLTRSSMICYAGVPRTVRIFGLVAPPVCARAKRNVSVNREGPNAFRLGCASQAGEDSRAVARVNMLLTSHLSEGVGFTIRRLGGSGLDAVTSTARGIRSNDAHLELAGNNEYMTRAPFVVGEVILASGQSAKNHATNFSFDGH